MSASGWPEAARARRAAWWALAVSGCVLGACGGRVVLSDAGGADEPGVLVAAGAEDPFIAADDEGGAYVAYTVRGAGCTGNQLFVQHMSAEGERLWPPDGVLMSEGCEPCVWRARAVRDGLGGVFVVWQDRCAYTVYDQPVGRWLLQHLAPDGSAYWPAPVVINGSDSASMTPAEGPPGEVWLAWDETAGVACDICLQRIDAAGAPVFAPPITVSADAARKWTSGLSPVSGGAVALLWNSFGCCPGEPFIDWPEGYLMVFEADGSPRWDSWPAEGVLLGYFLRPESTNYLAELPGGDFLVATWALPILSDKMFPPELRPYDEKGQLWAVTSAGTVPPAFPVPVVPNHVVADSLNDGWAFAAGGDVGEGNDLEVRLEAWEGLTRAWVTTIPAMGPGFLVRASPSMTYVLGMLVRGDRDIALTAAGVSRSGALVWGPAAMSFGGTMDHGGLVWDRRDGALTTWTSDAGVMFQRFLPTGPLF